MTRGWQVIVMMLVLSNLLLALIVHDVRSTQHSQNQTIDEIIKLDRLQNQTIERLIGR